MAHVTKRIQVCDIGMEDCDNEILHRCRVTIDGQTKQLTLCPKHTAPLRPFLEGRKAPGRRAKIWTLEEIEAAKEPPQKKRRPRK